MNLLMNCNSHYTDEKISNKIAKYIFETYEELWNSNTTQVQNIFCIPRFKDIDTLADTVWVGHFDKAS